MLLKNTLSLSASWQQLKSILLPSTCILCAVTVNGRLELCAACEADLPWLATVCSICAIPITAKETMQPIICGHCLQQPPPYFKTTALFHYQTPVDNFITALKFQQQLLYARLFGELLSKRLQAIYSDQVLPELIIPVPLHPKRLRERGFNQALEIARPIAKKLKLPIDIIHCERIRMTAAQSLLAANERQTNLKNAFKIQPTLKAKHVAIIDDVITTGHTITEFSKALQQIGVERIDIWSVARTDL